MTHGQTGSILCNEQVVIQDNIRVFPCAIVPMLQIAEKKNGIISMYSPGLDAKFHSSFCSSLYFGNERCQITQL